MRPGKVRSGSVRRDSVGIGVEECGRQGKMRFEVGYGMARNEAVWQARLGETRWEADR